MASKYGSLKLPALKEELRKRNARLSGRKEELVERFVQKYLELRSKADPGTDVFKQTLKALHPLHKKDVQVVKDKKIVEEKKISLLKQMLHGLKDKGQAQETPADDILDEHMLEQLFNEMPEIDSVNETDGSVKIETDESVKLPVEDYSVFDEKNFKS